MHSELKKRDMRRKKRALRVRKGVRGTSQKPRLSLHRSNRHLFAQLIDDESGKTVASFGTRSKALQGSDHNKKSKESAHAVGLKISELAKEKKIEKVVFDRGFCKYHGILEAVANGAREGGLRF